MVDRAAARLGKKGGLNSRKYLDTEVATALAQKAVKARWDAYYAAHPDKLKAKLERQARKGKVKRGRPRKK
jgi:ribosome-associated translation inhibitor RaiA